MDNKATRRPFYDDMQREQSLRYHAAELVGTPFAPHAMIPGAGIDCIHVNAWVYLKTKFLKTFEPPRYSLDSGSHARESQLLRWLDAYPGFQALEVKPHSPESFEPGLVPGDTICFNMGLSEHHVGLMLDAKRFIHVLPRANVIVSSLDERYYARRVMAVYRPMEEEARLPS